MGFPLQTSVCEQGLSVQPAVFLHVGQVHEQIERRPGQHLIDVWIVMRHAILCGALLRARMMSHTLTSST